VLGIFNSYTEASNRPFLHFRVSNVEWFVQDNWKVNRRLTLDYGLRPGCLIPEHGKYMQAANFFPDQFNAANAPLLYVPGCGANVSFTYGARRTAEQLADSLMAVQLETPCDTAVRLAGKAEKVVLPVRDVDRFWSEPDIVRKLPRARELFARELEVLRGQHVQGIPAQVKAGRDSQRLLLALVEELRADEAGVDVGQVGRCRGLSAPRTSVMPSSPEATPDIVP
jgi:hypothetical protein